MVPPSDIVESVDMDLSEDEDTRKDIYYEYTTKSESQSRSFKVILLRTQKGEYGLERSSLGA